jgi:hypothetical protein
MCIYVPNNKYPLSTIPSAKRSARQTTAAIGDILRDTQNAGALSESDQMLFLIPKLHPRHYKTSAVTSEPGTPEPAHCALRTALRTLH